MRLLRSSVTAAITASIASSPSFFAAFGWPAATSFAVQDSSGEAFDRASTIVSRSLSVNSLIISLSVSVETHVDAAGRHIALRFADGIGAEVEDRGGENRGRMA